MEQLLNLRNLLEHQIEDLYSAEEQIIDALPKLVETAKDARLKKALSEHLSITREHKKRLDRIKQVFAKEKQEDDNKAKSFIERIFGGGVKCKGMEGLITEGEKVVKEDMDPQVKDAAIIAAAQKVEHYEISGYGTARAYAAQLKLVEIERLLNTTLNEEYQADDLLTALALGKVNLEAEGNRGNNRGGNRTAAPAKKSTPVQNKGGAKKATSSKKNAPAAKKKTVRKK